MSGAKSPGNAVDCLRKLPVRTRLNVQREGRIVPVSLSQNCPQIAIDEKRIDRSLPWRRPLYGIEYLSRTISQTPITLLQIFVEALVQYVLSIAPPAPEA